MESEWNVGDGCRSEMDVKWTGCPSDYFSFSPPGNWPSPPGAESNRHQKQHILAEVNAR